VKQLTLRDARKRAGLTQVELAEASGVLQTTISRIECGGATDPNFSTVVRLAKVLGIRPEQLRFDGRDEAVA
jgi:transcriptional regulator with XRE-family HTH domain